MLYLTVFLMHVKWSYAYDSCLFTESGSRNSEDSVDLKKSNHIASDIKVEYSNNTVDDWQQDMVLPPRYPPPAQTDYDELRYPFKVCWNAITLFSRMSNWTFDME